MYNEFAGQVSTEKSNRRMPRKPDYNNPFTRSRKKLNKQIESTARELGRTKQDIAFDYVKGNVGTIQKYVLSQNERPMENPIDLAAQAYILRNKEILKASKTMNVPKEDAEIFLEESESNAANYNSADADNFLGAIFGAIGNVVEGIAQKQADKRVSKGKKPGVWGTIAKIAGGNQQSSVGSDTNGEDGSGIKVFAENVLDAIKRSETKSQISKILPVAIISVIIIILIIVLIVKGGKK